MLLAGVWWASRGRAGEGEGEGDCFSISAALLRGSVAVAVAVIMEGGQQMEGGRGGIYNPARLVSVTWERLEARARAVRGARTWIVWSEMVAEQQSTSRGTTPPL